MKNYLFKINLSLFILVAAICVSCSSSSTENGEGEVILDIRKSININSKSNLPGDNIDEYRINIYKENEPYAGWDKFSQLPEGNKIRLAYGSYEAIADWGENQIIDFEKPYFIGITPFTLNSNEKVTPIEILCKVGNASIKIIYHDTFIKHFSQFKSYGVNIYTDLSGDKFLYYGADETRLAHFKVSRVIPRLQLEKQDGTKFDYGFNYISNVKAGDAYTVRLKHNPTSNEGSVVITIDESTRDIHEEFSVPFEDIFKRRLEIKNSFNDEIATIATKPTNEHKLSTYFNATQGLKDIKFSFNPLFANANALPQEISFLTLKTNEELSTKLKNMGFEWDENFEGKKETILRYYKLLDYVTTETFNNEYQNDFAITVTDNENKTKTKSFAVKTTPKPLHYTIPSIKRASIWTKEASIPKMTYENFPYEFWEANKNNFTYQYSVDGQNWIDVTEDTGNTLRISNLTANTTYSYRAKLDDIYSAVKTFTTENPLQLQNANFETWGSKDVNNQFLGTAENEYWGSSNTQTTSSGINSWYTKNSGVRKYEVSGSNNAALISTIGWGAGNTWAGFMWSAVIYNVSAGYLVVGDVNTNGVITKGRTHEARPTSLSFDYKYKPTNGRSWKMLVEILAADGSVLGSGTASSGTKVDNFTKQNVDITYTNTTTAPSKIYLYFTNNTAQGTDLPKKDIEKLDNPNRYEGSPMVIDNINLIYNK